MALDLLLQATAAGFVVGGFILGAAELIGKIVGTYSVLKRPEYSPEQRLIYLLLVWLIPFGWLVYFLLGRERTAELFSEVDIT